MKTRDHDQCDECGYDASRWDDRDSIKTIGLAADLVGLWSAGVELADLNTRPRPEVWSVAEYADHVRETLFSMRFIVDLAAKESGKDLGPDIEPSSAGRHQVVDVDRAIDDVGVEAAALTGALTKLSADDWTKFVVIGGRAHSIRWASRHAVHDLWHHLIDIAAISANLAQQPTVQEGTIQQISRSTGGVPKLAVAEAQITWSGIEGDVQGARAHHGRPWQALCLWSGDVIDALVAEGHPIAAGSAGDNITVRGWDWSQVHAGLVVEIGQIQAQISAPAIPCAKNNQWFADGDSRRIDNDLHPGWSRWYASVVSPGTIRAGDTITLSSMS